MAHLEGSEAFRMHQMTRHAPVDRTYSGRTRALSLDPWALPPDPATFPRRRSPRRRWQGGYPGDGASRPQHPDEAQLMRRSFKKQEPGPPFQAVP